MFELLTGLGAAIVDLAVAGYGLLGAGADGVLDAAGEGPEAPAMLAVLAFGGGLAALIARRFLHRRRMRAAQRDRDLRYSVN